MTSSIPQQQQQQNTQQELPLSPPSPIPISHSQSAVSAPSPQSETSIRNPTFQENDLLGLSIDPQDDDTAPSSSDDTNTPVYTVEGEVPEEEELKGAVIYGYLRKLGRNGKWQRRFFETDGESLSYYRSEKRTTQLAALDLRKVGTICLSAEDPCIFYVQVADRPYSLKAENRQTCMDWVITLNRVKEARLKMGGVTLVSPKYQESSVAPRVVLKANRARTRAVNDDDQWRDMMENQMVSVQSQAQNLEQLQDSLTQHLTQWHKPRNTYYRVKHKVIKWARSIRKLAVACSNPTPDSVLLDSHLHPPGHDKPTRATRAEEKVEEDAAPRYLD